MFWFYSYSQTSITFKLTDIALENGQQVGLRGSVSPLSWDKSWPVYQTEEGFSTTVEFESKDQELEFKFVLFKNDKKPQWEGIQNRTVDIVVDQQQVSMNRWNTDQLVDISTLSPIPSSDLLKDYELIETMVLEVHPGTYRYNSKTEIAESLARLKSTFQKDLTHQEAYLAISRVTAQLKCDHTKAGFNNQKKVMNSILHFQRDKLPFAFKWIGDEMIVTYSASNQEELKRGTKVVSINQVPVAEIKKQLMPYIGADGATDQNRVYKLEVNGYDFRYNAFDIFYPLHFPIHGQELVLQVQPYGEEEDVQIQTSYLTREERAQILANRYDDFPESRDDLWKLEIRFDSIAVLTLNSFGLYGWKAMTIDYKAFLADAFRQMEEQEVTHLVLDIRENNGGNDEMADELYSYLAASKYAFAREGRMRYRTFPEHLKPHVQTWGNNPWYFNPKPKNPKPVDGYYVFKENFSTKVKNKRRKKFTGEVYLLTSEANTSLAFYTAHRFKNQKMGQIIGRETGGNLNDINGGQILFLRLPYSDIEIDFPVMGGFATQPQSDSGVVPDVITTITPADIYHDRDVEIGKVLELIQK